MPELQPDSASIGVIFQYPNPVDETRLRDWLINQGYEGEDRGPPHRRGGRPGIHIGERRRPGNVIAHKESTQVHYEADASLVGFGNCSFITVQEPKRGQFDSLMTAIREIEPVFEQLGFAGQVEIFETILEGNIRLTEDYKITEFVDSDVMEEVTSIHGNSSEALTLRLNSSIDPSKPNWFRIHLDASANKNPLLWRTVYQRRYAEIDLIDSENIVDRILETVELAHES